MSYTSIEAVEGVASPSPFSCPSCGGVLWNVNHGNQVHSFRCHAGHAFGQEGLLDFKSREVEETLWASLRLLEEHKCILVNFTKAGQGTPLPTISVSRRTSATSISLEGYCWQIEQKELGQPNPEEETPPKATAPEELLVKPRFS